MEKVWLSSTYYMDPAVEALTGDAERMFTRMMAYCGNAETRGEVSLQSIARVGLRSPRALAQQLVQAGIWEVIEGVGWRFRNWDDWQESGNKLLERQEADRKRKRRQREREEEMSRDTSRDVTPTEKRREEQIHTRVVEVSHVSNAKAPETPSLESSDLGPRCERHLTDPNPPACRGCGDARRAADAIAAQEAADWQRIKSNATRQRAELVQEAIDECAMCDERGYFGTTVCNHDPDIVDTAKRGMDLVRAVLAKSAQERS